MSRSFAESYLGRLRQKIGTSMVLSPAVRAVLEDSQGRILLQKRRDFGIWGLPGGHPEERETALECIRREVLEETGLRVAEFQCYGFSSNPKYEITIYPNGDQLQSYAVLVFARQWEGTPIESNEETLATGFFRPEKLPEMLKNERDSLEKYLAYKQTGQFQLD